MRNLSGLIILTVTASLAVAGKTSENPLEAGIATFSTAYADWDGGGFYRAAEQFRAAVESEPESFPARYWLGAARFHQALIFLDPPEDEEKAETALDGAEEALDAARELNDSCGECLALLSAITGLRIGLNPLSGIWRGSRFQNQAEEALRLSPENPRVHYLLGTNYYHGPERLGGRKKAREYFLRAENLYQKELQTAAEPGRPRWGYDSTLTFLGEIYREEGEPERAGDYYRRALAVNPSNGKARRGLEQLESSEESDE